MELKQYCPYCSGKIAYPSEMAGSSTVCPHCQREVELDREIKQECRACGEKVGFPESLLGESVACPHCGKSMKLHRSVADAFKQASAGRDTGSSVQYFLHMGGKVEGPLTEAEVCGLVEQGNIRPDTMARMGDANEWFPLGQLSQFTASFQKHNTPTIQEEAPSDEGPAEIMLMVKGAQHGPYTIGQIIHGLKTGNVDSHTPANRPGLPGWIELRQWSEFQELARQVDLVKDEAKDQNRIKNPHTIPALACGIILIITVVIIPIIGALKDGLVGGISGVTLSVVILWLSYIAWIFNNVMNNAEEFLNGPGGVMGAIFMSIVPSQNLFAWVFFVPVFFLFTRTASILLTVFFFPAVFFLMLSVRSSILFFSYESRRTKELALCIIGMALSFLSFVYVFAVILIPVLLK